MRSAYGAAAGDGGELFGRDRIAELGQSFKDLRVALVASLAQLDERRAQLTAGRRLGARRLSAGSRGAGRIAAGSRADG